MQKQKSENREAENWEQGQDEKNGSLCQYEVEAVAKNKGHSSDWNQGRVAFPNLLSE